MTRTLLVITLFAALGCGKKKQEPSSGGSGATGSAMAPAAPTGGSAGATVAPPGAVVTACDHAARDVQGSEGSSWLMTCPAGCEQKNVWGTDIYTDDSTLCTAAIHAGAIEAAKGGTVLVTWTPGQPTYVASSRNGITTSDYGAWGRSFYVQKVGADGKPTSEAPALIKEPNTAHLSCAMSAGVLTGDAGTKWKVDCPSGCTASNVWGSGPYTGDSGVCWAAKHAGVIDNAGGPFVVTIEGAKDAFQGTEKNGVTTSDYAHYDRTFTVAKQ
jgi:hypothetical protein